MRVLCSVLFLLTVTLCYSSRNYRILMRSTELLYTKDDVITVHDFSVKKLNRTYTVLNCNVTFKVTLNKVFVHIQMYEQRSNSFYPTFMNNTFDSCYLLTHIDKVPYLHIIADLYFNEKNNVPKKCPVKAGNYFVKEVHIFEEKLPPFFLPAGKYKFEATFKNEKEIFVKAHIVIEIINVVTRKQQIS